MFDPLLIGIIFLLAGFIQGMTGFGSALVAIPLLSLFLDIKSAVPLCMLNSLVITTFLSLKMRKHLDRKKLIPLCLAAVPGIIIGSTLLKLVSSTVIRISMGILIVAYSLYSLFSTPKPRKLHKAWSYVAGFSSGAIGAAFSAGGPPTIIYTTLNGWNKDEIKATLSGFFLFNAYLTASVHAVSGLTTLEVFSFFMVSAPFVLLGTVIGSICYGRIPHNLYLQLIFTFLVLMGIMMIIT
ncbi:MAG: sulfite exporter TauE/SafE family protein [Proteobacteria bacterium]|nr:sulfite exporter TauE/SafE family protein [Pseudomonadota bacterium]MBU1417610.1 sulfite exporter TauE/SafE family protein [Pseudomonadota bacterium]MBU1456431.1 sulfite exporter TauE/SafE family protein [Pseudomonadota bacterium]